MEPLETSDSAVASYPVRLDNFEGPLDLLIHLIKKNEVNIYDIPIALITRQYLDYLDLMRELDLDLAGDFLVMAATLIHIKSRMLLPRPDPAQEDPEEDPREVLVKRLIEHQKYKAAAELLHERETLREAQWMRPDERVAAIAGEEYEPEIEVDLFTLLSAFRDVMERAKQRPRLALPPEQAVDRRSHRAAAGPVVRDRSVWLRRPVQRPEQQERDGRHLPRAARDDPPEADSRVPGGRDGGDPHLQAAPPR